MSDRVLINQFMRALVTKAGGPASAASYIDAGLGIPLQNGESTRVGTISKRLAGHLSWPLDEIMALEDALGDHPVRRWLTGTLPEAAQTADLMTCISESSREFGEAIGAVADLASGRGDRMRTMKEIHDARQAMDRLAVAVNGGDQ